MTRPIRARIDLAALRRNYLVARRQASGAKKVFAVVKANAYGHGLSRVAAALADLAGGFALIELDGAVQLRQMGLTQPILLLEGFYAPSEIPDFITHRLIPAIHSPRQVEWLLASPWPAELPVVLKCDSGMNRLGLTAAELAAAHAALTARVRTIVAMTHFADADGPRGIAWQLVRFRAATANLAFAAVSLANSATVLRHPEAHGDWVRAGIMVYGGSPFYPEISATALGLAPVMTLEAGILAVRELSAGETVGYGCAFVAEQPMRIGIVACGYADGYPRHAPSGTPVLVDGRRSRLIGRVSMDKLSVDLTGLPMAGVGSTVTLWGRHGDRVLSADEAAAAAGTISYELFCALSARVPVVEEG